MYDRPKRGAITILFRVLVQRQIGRMHFPAEEIADLGFFDRLPANATPSAKFFWESKDLPPFRPAWPKFGLRRKKPKKSDGRERNSTRLNSSHTEIYTLSLHDALPITPSAKFFWESKDLPPFRPAWPKFGLRRKKPKKSDG